MVINKVCLEILLEFCVKSFDELWIGLILLVCSTDLPKQILQPYNIVFENKAFPLGKLILTICPIPVVTVL